MESWVNSSWIAPLSTYQPISEFPSNILKQSQSQPFLTFQEIGVIQFQNWQSRAMRVPKLWRKTTGHFLETFLPLIIFICFNCLNLVILRNSSVTELIVTAQLYPSLNFVCMTLANKGNKDYRLQITIHAFDSFYSSAMLPRLLMSPGLVLRTKA